MFSVASQSPWRTMLSYSSRGLGFGIAAAHQAVSHDPAFALVGGGARLDVLDQEARLVFGGDGDEVVIDMPGGELTPRFRTAGIYERRVRLLDRLGQQETTLDVVELAVMIEILFGPGPLDDAQPFVSHAVPRVMVALFDAEHLYLGAEPAAHDVETETPGGDVVDGGRLLGGQQRMHGRHVGGGEHHQLLGVAGHGRGPGIDLEIVGVEPGAATEMFPAPDRHQEFEADAIGEPGYLDVVLVGRLEAGRRVGDGAAVAAVHAKDAELELVGVEHRHMGATPCAYVVGVGHDPGDSFSALAAWCVPWAAAVGGPSLHRGGCA
jgi:hypothetical protein